MDPFWRLEPSKPAAIPSGVRDLHFIGDELLGIDVRGAVHRFDATDGWVEVAPPAMPAGVGMQLTLTAWNGDIHGIGSDGRVVVLRAAPFAWHEVHGAADEFPGAWPKGAFDARRGVFVVWGPRTSKGFKDDTWLFDGKAWSKAKKSKAALTDAIKEASEGAFQLYFDARLGCVARVGTREASYFEGDGWRSVPLDGGAALGDWERTPALHGDGSVLSVQRFGRQSNLVRLDFDADVARATEVLRFPRAVDRKPTDPGGNVAFDQHAFHPPTSQLVVFDATSGRRYAARIDTRNHSGAQVDTPAPTMREE